MTVVWFDRAWRVALLPAALLVASCATSPKLAQTADSAAVALVPVYYMTTRDAAAGSNLYSEGRANAASFGLVTIGIPPNHQVGKVEWPSAHPDPAREMTLVGHSRLKTLDAMAAEAAAAAGTDPLAIFVHGFNNSFAESTLRLAQIAHDGALSVSAVHFSWASQGRTSGYLYDLDSATLATDELADLLVAASRRTKGDLIVVAHSMGSRLVLQSLIDLTARRSHDTLSAIDQVLLISPDIDVDVFAELLSRIDLPRDRITVMINRKDRILALAGQVSGSRARVGRDIPAESLRGWGLNVLDLTGLDDGDRSGHFLPGTSPTLLAAFRTLDIIRNPFGIMTQPKPRVPSEGSTTGTITARNRKDESVAFVARVRVMRDGANNHETETFYRRPAATWWIKKRKRELARPGATTADKTADPPPAKANDQRTGEPLKE